MSSLFSKIIAGEIPGRFVWSDADVVAFLDVRPQTDGHVLVVPRAETDKWTEAEPDLYAKVTAVAQKIGAAQVREFGSARAGTTIMGFEVPHLHVHVWPVNSMRDYDFTSPGGNAEPEALDAAAARLRAALRADGHADAVPAD
ncbi:HIT family protein [Zhihengliuella halotolerans]|uniref:Diadenosine tetraphosphate (Ap4A) HIT family hydrolase n=1 Tax=Zhihengliuella halotolerans TaxID=370736 RepID=A0A4Q8AC22_9MICC|nr:HIT family protein [Zhihengliuella halotolerans]RZU61688.1 diadenosine tetraphosphate (Ap4A) HIT family hydrolase [Zhihengliuella halotolerans]